MARVQDIELEIVRCDARKDDLERELSELLMADVPFKKGDIAEVTYWGKTKTMQCMDVLLGISWIGNGKHELRAKFLPIKKNGELAKVGEVTLRNPEFGAVRVLEAAHD